MNEKSTLHHGSARLLAGVALVSFAALLLELSLTRLFSVVLFYHFAFLAISVALLGLGAGGVFAFVRRTWLLRFGARQISAVCCLAGSLLTLAVLEIVLHSSVSLDLTTGNFFRLTIVYLASACPFFCCGVLLSVVFARMAGSIPRLYGADLTGGAVACLFTVPALNWLGGPNAILCSALALAMAAALWSEAPRLRNAGLALAAVFFALTALNLHGRLFDIIYAKGMYRDPKWVEYSKWNAISRVEVDNQGGARVIVIDADATTYIPHLDPDRFREWGPQLMRAVPGVVNVLRPSGDFAIIGPGGGEDILRAVANGSQKVVGAEINPAIANNIMRNRYAAYSYNLYTRPQVHVHVSDGRTFVRQSHDKYDVIQMTLVDTWASTAAGAFALSENNLYTKEAFREYFDHLKPDGMIAITRWEFKSPREALRVVANAMAVLQDLGVQDITKHFVIVSDGELNEDGRPVLVLAKKSEFTPEEERRVFLHLEQYKNLHLIYSPSDRSRAAGVSPIDAHLRWNPFTAMIVSRDPVGFAEKYQYNVSPVTDDAPFFFFTLKLKQLFTHSPLQKGIDWKVNLGVLVLLILFALSIVAVLAFLLLPLALHAPAKGESPWRLLYFIVIGLGYILVEITLIQRFVLFLGHPVYALTVVVFLMLLSSGVGSLVSRRWIPNPYRVWWVAAVISAVALAYVFVLPRILHGAIGVSFALKLLISGALLIPLGLLMGMPFPTGLRAMAPGSQAIADAELGAAGDGSRVEWAWALNASSSVLGSVLAMLMAIQWGLHATLILAAFCYGFAGVLSQAFRAAPLAAKAAK
jgi:Spermine/spermidine synthase domain